MFGNRVRQQLAARGERPEDLSAYVAARWRELNPLERQKLQRQANAAREKYREQLQQ